MSQNLKKKTTNFVPIWEYCVKHKVDRQKVYRWIREGKVPQDKMKKVTKTVERIYLDDTWG